jgi:hypothetical protein
VLGIYQQEDDEARNRFDAKRVFTLFEMIERYAEAES